MNSQFGMPPDQIGPYRILEELGEGGMGTVYLAQQDQPVRRRVALKIIKRGMDSKEVIGRFEAERQALAIMNHAHIAHVFDAGMTDDGRPFFAMEHVAGIPLTKYCDLHRLNTEERLELFIPICEAIHHAHQKGVIHRDLKPSNILVAVQDGGPVPKVIDFGLAKAISQRLSQKTVYTEQGRLLGTPAYMSPEQAEMTGLNVDTTTDIYSLGVILYELLTGDLPFDPKTLQKAGLAEFERMVREVDPPRPSNRVSSTGPAALESELRGELDWIVMRAMEKDRTHRYQSASELATDIRRHLQNLPILAGPPGTLYQVRKIIARHTTAFAFAATVVLLLVGFGVAMGVLYRRASRAEKLAEAEAEKARIEARTSQQISEFLTGLFEVSDPGEARGRTITAAEILDSGSKKIDQALGDQPVIRARLMDTIGNVYMNLGLFDQADRMLRAAVETHRKGPGLEGADWARSLSHLGYLRKKQGNHAEGEVLLRQAMAFQDSLLGPDHIDTAWTEYYLGSILAVTGRSKKARDLLNRARRTFEQTYGTDHFSVAWAYTDASITLYNEGRHDSAIAYSKIAYDIKRRILPEDHPDVSLALNAIGYLLVLSNRLDEAGPYLIRSLAIGEKTLGPDHPEVANILQSLGEYYRLTGDHAAARTTLERALRIQEAHLSADDPYMALTVASLAREARFTGRLDEAENLMKRCVSILRHNGPGSELQVILKEYADLLRELNRAAEADSVTMAAESLHR